MPHETFQLGETVEHRTTLHAWERELARRLPGVAATAGAATAGSA